MQSGSSARPRFRERSDPDADSHADPSRSGPTRPPQRAARSSRPVLAPRRSLKPPPPDSRRSREAVRGRDFERDPTHLRILPFPLLFAGRSHGSDPHDPARPTPDRMLAGLPPASVRRNRRGQGCHLRCSRSRPPPPGFRNTTPDDTPSGRRLRPPWARERASGMPSRDGASHPQSILRGRRCPPRGFPTHRAPFAKRPSETANRRVSHFDSTQPEQNRSSRLPCKSNGALPRHGPCSCWSGA